MSELPGSPLGGGRQFKVHGFEVVVHTTRVLAERSLCFVFLTDPFDERREVRIFRGRGATSEEAEQATLREALAYLDVPNTRDNVSILTGRSTLNIAGRKVDIFCDLAGGGKYQAFPFIYLPDGSRVLILRFHLDEAITGATPGEAISACIVRLEAFFERDTSETPSRLAG